MAGLLSPSGAPGLLSRSRTDVVLKRLGSCTPSFSPSLPPQGRPCRPAGGGQGDLQMGGQAGHAFRQNFSP